MIGWLVWWLGCGAAESEASEPREVTCIDRQALSQGDASDGTRVVPMVTDGQSQGYRLFSIREGSLTAKLGLRNGDILKEIDGAPAVLETLQALYPTWAQRPSLALRLERRGSPLELEIRFDCKQ